MALRVSIFPFVYRTASRSQLNLVSMEMSYYILWVVIQWTGQGFPDYRLPLVFPWSALKEVDLRDVTEYIQRYISFGQDFPLNHRSLGVG